MKVSEYLTRDRVLYYAAISIVAFIFQIVGKMVIGEHGANAALVGLMWVLLVIDAKVVPRRISLIRPFLPGFTWMDLFLFVPVCAGFAFVAYNVDQVTDRRYFMIFFVMALPLLCVFGIVCLFRLQRWRGEK